MLIEKDSNLIKKLFRYIDKTVIVEFFNGNKIKALIYSEDKDIYLKLIEVITLCTEGIEKKIELSYNNYPYNIVCLDNYTVWCAEYEFAHKLLTNSFRQKGVFKLYWKDGTIIKTSYYTDYYMDSEEIEDEIGVLYDKLHPRFELYKFIVMKVKEVIFVSPDFYKYGVNGVIDDKVELNPIEIGGVIEFSHYDAPSKVELNGEIIYDLDEKLKKFKKDLENFLKMEEEGEFK